MLEGHVEPGAVILRTDPAGGPETEDKADLGEYYRVGRRLRPVSSLSRSQFASLFGVDN